MLETRNLVKKVGPRDAELTILRGITLSVGKGEAVAIMGPSGCGKSTLLSILAGLDAPTEGTVLLDGTDLYALGKKERDALCAQKIGIVFQQHNLLSELTCLENIEMPLVFRKSTKQDYDLARQLLHQFGLDDSAKKFPYHLSGGEQQRVAIARALVTAPSLVLADEPTGALDQENGDLIIDYFLRMRAQYNYTFVMVTHDLQVAKRCDRIVRMLDGRVMDDAK